LKVQGNKKILVIGVLIVVIAVSVIVALKRAGLIGKVRPPDYVMQQTLEMMDSKDMDVLMTKTLAEWENLGHNDNGCYKNPKTGKYTMVPPMICAACGQKIPRPETSAEQQDSVREMMKIMAEYKCPKCGKPCVTIMGPGMTAPPPPGMLPPGAPTVAPTN
jgi:predicted RNA-binding Zn-ribbon protein involved in translation (DUF1610 family)